jgi:uncharacterized membrane protein
MARKNTGGKRQPPSALRPARAVQALPAPGGERASRRSQVVQSQVSMTQGIIPPPEMLRDYDSLVPGTAQKMFEAFLKQGEHRREMERHVIEARIRLQFIGMWLGFAVALASLAAFVAMAIALREPLVGLGVFGSIAVLAGVFVYSAQSQKQERIEKARILSEEE